MKKVSKKKIIPIIIIFIILVTSLLFFILGSNKTMSCTKLDYVSDLTVQTQVEINFKYNKIKTVDLSMKVDIEEFSEYKDNLLNSLSNYENDIEINTEGNIVNISIKGDSSILNVSKKEKYDSVKNQLENQEYSCK